MLSSMVFLMKRARLYNETSFVVVWIRCKAELEQALRSRGAPFARKRRCAILVRPMSIYQLPIV